MASPIDGDKFREAIVARRGSMSLRAAASEIGISFATLSRLERGTLPDLTTYVLLCLWLGVSLNEFASL